MGACSIRLVLLLVSMGPSRAVFGLHPPICTDAKPWAHFVAGCWKHLSASWAGCRQLNFFRPFLGPPFSLPFLTL